MYLSDVNAALDHRITGGSEYGWNCYPEARSLDFESTHAWANVIFNSKTQEIYEASAEFRIKEGARPYRWLNPDYSAGLTAESATRGFDHTIAWDDIKWIDLDLAQDFLDKATAMFNDESFDTRVQVPLELDNETFIRLAKEAHERDITLNAMVELILRRVIESEEVLGE